MNTNNVNQINEHSALPHGRSGMRCLLIVLFLSLAGCQNTLVLMPTPEVMRTGEVDVFELTPEWERTLEIPVIYATNRLPAKDINKKGYTKKFDDRLRMGVARIRVGDDPEAKWDDLYQISIAAERAQEVPLRLDGVEEMLIVEPGTDMKEPGAETIAVLERLNELLQNSEDPDLLVFVHGANNNFYRTVGQAAQYRHFTGRQTAVVAFVWPSLENLFRYGGDIKNAKISAPLLTDLLELLALHTEARYINVLGYSLGAQVVSNALNELRQRYVDQDPGATKNLLRIGEVYYAAADVDFRQFVEQFYFYSDIVGRVSLTVNLKDSALGMSQMVQGESRAGRPDIDELSAEQTQWLLEASNSEDFDVLAVGQAIAPYEAFSAHDYWYNNPRVSTDVILQMLSHAPPALRGLDKFTTENGYEVWTFPDNYQERALEAVRAMRRTAEQEQ